MGKWTRRAFLTSGALLGGGLIVGSTRKRLGKNFT